MNKFDVIVVGAGPAGITTAYLLAQRGINTLLLERGENVGAKNMFGGVVVGDWFPTVVDDFWTEGIVERPITRKKFSVLGNNKMLSVDLASSDLDNPYGFTAYRPKFDKWYAGIAQKKGVNLVTETSVVGLLYEGTRVVGVKTDRCDGEICSNVVVLADGANSIIHEKEMHADRTRYLEYSIGVKEVIRVGSDVFKRLGVGTSREGMSHEFVGLDPPLVGGGFLYTNSDSLSVGVVVKLRSLLAAGRSIAEIFDAFKNIPYVRVIIAEGRSVEYSAHLIPSACSKGGTLFSDGLLVTGDAAGLVLNTGLHFEGVNYAVRSGIAAADTALACMKTGIYSSKATGKYIEYLKVHNVLNDVKKYRRAMDLVQSPAFHRNVPANICHSFDKLFGSARTGRKNKFLRDILCDADIEDRTAYLKQLYKIFRAYVC